MLNEAAKPYPCWRASSLGGCPRKHFYKRLGISETVPMPIHKLRTFAVGNVFHEFVYKVLRERNIPLEEELEMYNKDLDLGGRLDLLIRGEDLIDIKSQHSNSFHWIRKSHANIFAQYPHHEVQIGTYMLMRKLEDKPVKRAAVWYLSKDDMSMAGQPAKLTRNLEDKIMEELNILNACWKNLTLPPCTCTGYRKEDCVYGDIKTRKRVTLRTPKTGKIKMSGGKPVTKLMNQKCCDESLFEAFKKTATFAKATAHIKA